MRSVIASLFSLVAVFGPWLCCCVPAIALAKAPCHVTQPAKPTFPHCPHPKPADENKSEKPCPCKKYEAPAMKAAEPETALLWLFESAPVPQTLDRPAMIVGISTTTAAASTRDSPLLTTAMRLYAHHVLRC